MGTDFFWLECKVSISSFRYHWCGGEGPNTAFFQDNSNNITSVNELPELHFSFCCFHLIPITNSKIYRKRGLSFARTYYFAFLIFGSYIACIFHSSSWILSPLKRRRERKTGAPFGWGAWRAQGRGPTEAGQGIGLAVLLREKRIVNKGEWNWWECMTISVKRGNGTCV